jgi:hypothetical protein
MANPRDDEMILFLYGEHPDAEAFERALAGDEELRRRYEALARELSALASLEPPEPRPGLEQRVWHRVSREIAEPAPRFRVSGGWLGTRAAGFGRPAAVVALVAVGYLAGRRTAAPAPAVASAAEALPAAGRQRVLVAALSDHLDASERLLTEVSSRSADPERERRTAALLLANNRLYRHAAERAGQRRVAAVLAEIEPLLAELADAPPHSAAGADGAGIDSARERIENQDLLFKVRVTRSNI